MSPLVPPPLFRKPVQFLAKLKISTRESVRWRNADTVARNVLTGTSVETAPLSVLARGLTINRSVRISRGQGEGNRDNAG